MCVCVCSKWDPCLSKPSPTWYRILRTISFKSRGFGLLRVSPCGSIYLYLRPMSFLGPFFCNQTCSMRKTQYSIGFCSSTVPAWFPSFPAEFCPFPADKRLFSGMNPCQIKVSAHFMFSAQNPKRANEDLGMELSCKQQTAI